MPVYETKGRLTGTIEPENVAAAQKYLTEDDMTKYLDEPLQGVVLFQQWQLFADGHTYKVIAVTDRELTEDELKLLADNTSGQNSDGLGESFEQQDFAWDVDPDYDCECRGSDREWCQCADEAGSMISFDWETNDSTYVRVS